MVEVENTIIVMTEAQLEAFAQKILAGAHTQQPVNNKVEETYLDTKAAAAYLHVSTRTLQTYRDRKVLTFSQFGRKITFRRSDLEAFLESKKIG